MQPFEDLTVGQPFVTAAYTLTVDAIADFARRYDPAFLPRTDVTYAVGGPPASPLHMLALANRLLADQCDQPPIAGLTWLGAPFDIRFGETLEAGSQARVEWRIAERLPPSPRFRDHGFARIDATLKGDVADGLGHWTSKGDERSTVDAAHFSLQLRCNRRTSVNPWAGIA